jgi:hypothetical protein
MGSAAAHTHGATAKMGAAATKMHSATATAEMSTATAAAAAEMTAASSAAKMSTTTPAATAATAETAASGVSSRRQTQRKAYCGRARRDFPHDTTSSAGPNAQVCISQRQIARHRSGGLEVRDAAMHTSP